MTVPPPLKSLLRAVRRLIYDDVTVVVYGLELIAVENAISAGMQRWSRRTALDVQRLMQELGDCDDAVMAHREARGDECVTSTVDGRTVGFAWVSSVQMEMSEVGVTRPLAKGHIWIYHCHVLMPYRRRGLYRDLLRRILKERAHRGGAVAWIGAEKRNIASLRGIEKVGFRKVGHFRRVRLLGFTMNFESVLKDADPLSFALRNADGVDRMSGNPTKSDMSKPTGNTKMGADEKESPTEDQKDNHSTGPASAPAGVSAPAVSASPEKTGVTYTCPMHPEIRSDKPGRCPKCGMKLVHGSEHH